MRDQRRQRAACVLCAIVLLIGCSSRRQPIDFATTTPGATLSRLRHAHGGAARLERFKGVRFRYTMYSTTDKSVVLQSIAFRFDDPEHVWAQLSGAAVSKRVDLSQWPSRTDGSFGGSAVEHRLDFALRTARVFFEPATLSGFGAWTFRSLVAPQDIDAPKHVEMEARAPSLIPGPYLLQPHQETGLLARIVYDVQHPWLARQTQTVEFHDYQKFDGLCVARQRVYTRPWTAQDRAELGADPFRSTDVSSGPIEVLRDRIDDVLFLTSDEIDTWCPLPEKSDEQLVGPSSTGSTASGGIGRY